MWQVVAVLTGILGFFGILGELEMTGIGRAIYAGLKAVFGGITWGVPLIFLLVTIVIEVKLEKATQLRIGKSISRFLLKNENTNSKKRKPAQARKSKKSISLQEEKKGIPLPQGKLVSLQGFNDYFASDEGPEIESAATKEPLTELGRDFTTYFQEGQEFSFQPLGTQFTTVQPLKGFPSYFEHVQSEYEKESKISSVIPEKRDWLSVLKEDSEKRVPGQIAQLAQYQPQIESLKVEVPIQKETVQVKELSTANYSEDVPTVSYIEAKTMETQDPDCQLFNIKENLVESTPDLDISLPSIEVNEEFIEIDDNEVDASKIESGEEIITEVPDEVEVVEKSQIERQKSWSLPKFEILDPLLNIPVVYDTETQKNLNKFLPISEFRPKLFV